MAAKKAVGRGGATRKRRLRALSALGVPPVVLISERPVDASAYGISAREAEKGTELSVHFHHPQARTIADRVQSWMGSYWETDGNDFAYNMTTVWSDAERKKAIDELRRDGLGS